MIELRTQRVTAYDLHSSIQAPNRKLKHCQKSKQQKPQQLCNLVNNGLNMLSKKFSEAPNPPLIEKLKINNNGTQDKGAQSPHCSAQ